ncbi:MAG: OmpH family outer membrane protein [Leptospirales bacterium]|nr:OmpH family outer membrane protein [Leptospirales bacterium]
MVYFNRIFLFILLMTITSCSMSNLVNSNNSNNYVIKYINLNAIYEYIYNNSNEAQEIKRKIDSLNKKISDVENSKLSGSESELNYYREEMVKLKEQERQMKSGFYSRIKSAVDSVADKHNADFVFNLSDGLLYSKSEYDITDEIIKELKSIDERTSPIYK